MAIKRFRIETPEQLRALDEMRAKDQLSCSAYATVWSAARNGSGGKSSWDKDFQVRFVSERFGARKAYIDKVGLGGNPALRELKYNPALAYCRENLQMIEES